MTLRPIESDYSVDELLRLLKNRVKVARQIRKIGEDVSGHVKRIGELTLLLERAELAESAQRIRELEQKNPSNHLGATEG